MVRATLESRFAPQRLDELFRRTARRQHTHEFLFAQRVQLMTATVLRQQPSVHAAYKNPVAPITVYDQASLTSARSRPKRLPGSMPQRPARTNRTRYRPRSAFRLLAGYKYRGDRFLARGRGSRAS